MTDESVLPAYRRQFLAAVSAVALTGSVAGCAEIEDADSREYEATGAGLSDEARKELALAETLTETGRITRSAEEFGITATEPENNTSEGDDLYATDDVAVVNTVARYERDLEALDEASERRPTLLDSFVRTHNSDGHRGAVVASLDDPSEVMLDVPRFDRRPVNVVTPISSPLEGEAATRNALAMFTDDDYADVIEDGTVPTGGGYFMSIEEYLPGPEWHPGENGNIFHSTDGDQSWFSRWFPGGAPAYDEPRELRVLVLPAGARPKETFGVPPEELPGERIEEGESLSGSSNPFLVVVPGEISDWPTPDNFDSIRWPAPMGGLHYGVSVLASPNKDINGQPVSPLANVEYADYLTGDHAPQLLTYPTGEGQDGQVEWFGEPSEIVLDGTDDQRQMAPDGKEIFDQETELRTFGGWTTYESTTWLTLVHVARVMADDVVVMVGTHATPVNEEFAEKVAFDPTDRLWEDGVLAPLRWDVGSGRGFSGLTGTFISENPDR